MDEASYVDAPVLSNVWEIRLMPFLSYLAEPGQQPTRFELEFEQLANWQLSRKKRCPGIGKEIVVYVFAATKKVSQE
jgi:hypothetical protein